MISSQRPVRQSRLKNGSKIERFEGGVGRSRLKLNCTRFKGILGDWRFTVGFPRWTDRRIPFVAYSGTYRGLVRYRRAAMWHFDRRTFFSACLQWLLVVIDLMIRLAQRCIPNFLSSERVVRFLPFSNSATLGNRPGEDLRRWSCMRSSRS